MKKLSVAALILVTAISFAACSRPVAETTAVGTATGDPETKTIGAGGGTLSLSDGRLVLTVPPGARRRHLRQAGHPHVQSRG